MGSSYNDDETMPFEKKKNNEDEDLACIFMAQILIKPIFKVLLFKYIVC